MRSLGAASAFCIEPGGQTCPAAQFHRRQLMNEGSVSGPPIIFY
jgi:hypothetical protein